MVRTAANVVAEVGLESTGIHPDPFNDLTVDAVFATPQGTSLRVPAFWAGGNVWKVRYASGVAGAHRFRTECSEARDSGLHGIEGSIQVEPYEGDNTLYRHGPLRIAADRRHFEHADGTPFLWLADTWWMGLCRRLSWPGDFQTLLADRKAKGYNVIQIVAGLYPDQGAFDERGANETGFPWESDYGRIRPAYFDAADQRLSALVDQGMTPCVVGAWGFHLPWLGAEKMKQHLRYLVARYGAMPVVWCVAGEFNLPFYLTPDFPSGGDKQAEDWEQVIREFRSINAFGRLVTTHPTGIPPYATRLVLKDPGLIDFDMLQPGHGDTALSLTVTTLRNSLAAEPPMPVVNAEVAYDALGGAAPPTPPEFPRMACWISLLSGAAGHTYGANGIWQVNRKDRAYGNSPQGITYGEIPWDEAMHLPGGNEVALAGTLLARQPFEQFEPHAEWAESVTPPPGEFLAPYAAGVPSVVRVIYVPTGDAITVRCLEPGIRYAAERFDPVSGRVTVMGFAQADQSGSWSAPAPSWDHDWVLVLDARRQDAEAGDEPVQPL